MDTDPMARPAAPKSTAVHASPDLTIGNLNTRRRRSRPVVRSALPGRTGILRAKNGRPY